MAQTVVLTPQTSSDNGDDFVVGTTPQILVLYTTETDDNAGQVKLPVQQKGPGSVYAPYYKDQMQRKHNRPVYLTNTMRSVVIDSPGTYRINKAATTRSVGAYVETGAA